MVGKEQSHGETTQETSQADTGVLLLLLRVQTEEVTG